MARCLRSTAAFLVAALALAACAGSGGGREPVAPVPDLLGDWELVDGPAQDVTVPRPAGTRATITFEDGQAGGTSFCNYYSGSYRLSGTSLAFDGLGGTDMGCDPEIMTAESAFLAALGAVDTVAVDDNGLLLTGKDAVLRFRRIPAVPPSDLIGTRWVLDTLVDGEVASSTLGEPAVLVLAAGGALSGSTGCRTLSGRWARTGDVLAFPEVRADGDCPADVRNQDEHVLAVLADGTTAAVVADRLILTGPHGRGLGYRAEG